MKTYEIKTIADIIEQIPADRFDAFLADFTDGLRSVKATYDAIKVMADLIGISPKDAAQYDGMKWIDDGKVETTISMEAM